MILLIPDEESWKENLKTTYPLILQNIIRRGGIHSAYNYLKGRGKHDPYKFNKGGTPMSNKNQKNLADILKQIIGKLQEDDSSSVIL